MKLALFRFGQVVATPGAMAVMERLGINPADLIVRHVTCDWGDIDPEDDGQNEQALLDGSRIFSVYGERGRAMTACGSSPTPQDDGGQPAHHDDPSARRLLNKQRPPGRMDHPGGLTTRHETP